MGQQLRLQMHKVQVSISYTNKNQLEKKNEIRNRHKKIQQLI